MKYALQNVRRGEGEYAGNVYAELVDSEGAVEISATLVYILVACVVHGYEVTNVDQFYNA